MTLIDDILLDVAESLDEHQQNEWYFQRFKEHNPNLAPKVLDYINGDGVRPTEAELGTNHYARALVKAGDALRKKPQPDPDPEPTPVGEFLWDAPVLTSPITKTVSNSAPSIPKGSGQDLKIIVSEELDRAIGQIEGYNDVVMENFRIVGGTANASGHIIPRELTGTFFVKDGHVQLQVPADALAVRWRTPRAYHVNMYIEVTDNGTPYHSDAWQSQYSVMDELGFDCCTIKTDYQGIFQSNEAIMAGQPAPSRMDKTILSRLLFLPGKMGLPATWWFKAFPPRPNANPVGLTEMYDVWAPLQDILAHVYPNGHTWTAWDGTANKYGAFLETKMHPKLNHSVPFCRFSTVADKVPAGKALAGHTCGDVNVRGDGGIWCYNNLSEVPSYVGKQA